MSYTRGIVVQYQHQGAGIGIEPLIVQNHLYPTNTHSGPIKQMYLANLTSIVGRDLV